MACSGAGDPTVQYMTAASSMARFGLGSVQFGLPYGITNRNPVPALDAVVAMLGLAWCRGCFTLDTAAAYGNAEGVLGAALARLPAVQTDFRIITKTAPLTGKGSVTSADLEVVQTRFERSLVTLGRSSVYGLLVHHVGDLLRPGGRVLADWLKAIKDEGRVARIGVSVYTADEIDRVGELLSPDLVQLPFNLLDQRLLRSGHLRHLKANGCEIHARSIFLQGALLMQPRALPPAFATIRTLLERFHVEARTHGLSPLQACLAFVRGTTEIDAAIVGVTTEAELRECLAAFEDAADFDGANYQCDDPLVLNPALWGGA
jgi:aryl-alcohol dehydrogenase-like predicted oxidoreductase